MMKETINRIRKFRNDKDWAPEHEKMGKGITLTTDELKKLKNILNEMNL